MSSNENSNCNVHGCNCLSNALNNDANYPNAGSSNNTGYETISYLYYTGSMNDSSLGHPEEITAHLTPQIGSSKRSCATTELQVLPDTGASLNIAGPQHQRQMRICSAVTTAVQ